MVAVVQFPNLPAGIALSGSEIFAAVQNGVLRRFTADQIAALGVGTVAGGAANEIVYQTAPNVTGFITAPTVSSFLRWNGAAFVWSTTAPASSIDVDDTDIVDGTTLGLLYDNAGKLGNLATAANGVLVTSAGGVPSIGATLPTAVQNNITRLGTVVAGVWNGTVIGGTYGGTGVNNGASTITIGGSIAFSGGFTFTGTLTGNTAVTFPTSGTLSTTTGTVTSASVVTANGFAGSVATATTTPAITLSTTVTGLLKGNGTAISAASSGTDYAPATNGTSILYGNGAGGFSNVTVSTGLSFIGGTLSATGGTGTVTTVSVVTANGISGSVANATTTPAITLTLGAITPTTVNGLTISTTTGTFTLTNGKTFAVTSGLTLSGTDSTVMTFPSTSATIARTDAANTFTGTQTIGALVATTVNGNTFTTGTGVLTIAASKTLTASNSITLAGTDATAMTFPPASASIGYINLPQNSQSADYTLVLADSGKQIYHPSADTSARTWTIPANGTVAFAIGTAVTFTNDTSGGVITIAITTDTLVWSPAGTTGSRSLAANGTATIQKMTSTRWMISGSGLT